MNLSLKPSPNSTQINILLVEDHALLRAGLRMLIERQPGLKVVGEAANRADALAEAARQQPDVVVLDLVLGNESALDFIPELRAAARQARVLILTGVDDPAVQRRALRQGAVGVVLKGQSAEVLIKAIEKVHAGEAWLDRAATARLLSQSSPELDAEKAKIKTLSQREREVVELMAEGLGNQEMAKRLKISEATVRHHLTSIYDKLGVANRLELVIFAFRHDLAKLPR